jgi:hypothetical protein
MASGCSEPWARNFGLQAAKELESYRTPDDNRRLTEL